MWQKPIWLYCACRKQSGSFQKMPIPTLHGSKNSWNSGSIFQEFVVTFETRHCVFRFIQFQFLAFEEIEFQKTPREWQLDSTFISVSNRTGVLKFLRNGLRFTIKTVPQAREDALPATKWRMSNETPSKPLWHAINTIFGGLDPEILRIDWMVYHFFHLYIWV